MRRSLSRIRTSHVGRLPPPKGWTDMPARLADAEITDPVVIAAKVTPAIAETVKKQIEAGNRLHRRRRILDGTQSRPLCCPLHRCRGAPGSAGRAADDPALDPRARRISGFLWRLRPGGVAVSGPRRNADATGD